MHPCRLMLVNDRHEGTAVEESETIPLENSSDNAEADKHNAVQISEDESSNEEEEQAEQRQPVQEQLIQEIPCQQILAQPASETQAPVVSSSRLVRDPKKNSIIEYLPNNTENWVQGEVLSRAGKATGRYKHNWNVKNSDGQIMDLDFENDLAQWRYAEESTATEEEVNWCNIFTAEIDTKTEQAKQAELQNWINEKVYDEVQDNGQGTISVRWVITPKLIAGEMSTKARLVARGFEDNSPIRTDSPTCMRESLRITLAYSACKEWHVNSIDIKAAFLQGKPIDRDIFLRPPAEANSNGKLWKLNKVVYGLPDASRVWYLRVVEELGRLGVTSSSFDKAFFVWKVKGEVVGLMLVHVDDFLWAGSGQFVADVIQPLKNIFKISKECDSSFKYIGINISQGEGYIKLDQNSYIDSISPVDIGKKDKDVFLDKQEKKLYRGIVGQLNWSSGVTRPDISFSACQLSTVQANPKVSDVLLANKTLADLKREKVGIQYIPLNLNSIRLVTFADASYANLSDGGSQGGCIILLADEDYNAVPIAWASKRIKRVVRSTLSAETMAAVDALDTAYLIKKILQEIVSHEIPIEMYTDNKSLFDSIRTTNLVEDKRLRVDISSLRESYETKEVMFNWIDTKNQVADVLTKKGASKVGLFSLLKENRLGLA